MGCVDERVTELIGLGIPVDDSDLRYLQECSKPKLIVQGGYDQYGSRANVEAFFETLPEPKRLVIINGADHFFTGQLDKVAAEIDVWLDERHPRASSALAGLTSLLKELHELLARCWFHANQPQIGLHMRHLAHADQRRRQSRDRARKLQCERCVVL